MKKYDFKKVIIVGLNFFISTITYAGTPLWTFTPLTATTLTVSDSDTATIQYQITNQSKKSHTLTMKSISGISQNTASGNCANPFTLSFHQSCILNLTVTGSELRGNISGGPKVCERGNNLQCYQPSQANSLNITKTADPSEATLATSVSQLALSVSGLTEYGISGTPASGVARTIIITNTGNISATNLTINTPTFPAGTTSSSTCGATLNAGQSCTIAIAPGATASSNGASPCTSGTAPIPSSISITADNANTLSVDVFVLGYGCIYQGGYVYAFDDTIPSTASVGGKVATLSDQAAPQPNGLVWGTNGSGNQAVSLDEIPGIDETSTASSGSPTYNTFASFFSSTYTNINPFSSNSFNACNANIDGQCDTNNILALYNELITNFDSQGAPPFTASGGPTALSYYAAGLCSATINGYSDWYLPAICEMGYDTSTAGSGCGTANAPTLQNIQSNLIDYSGLGLSGYYWSSTQDSSHAQSNAWAQLFSSNANLQFTNTKNNLMGVRCSRIF